MVGLPVPTAKQKQRIALHRKRFDKEIPKRARKSSNPVDNSTETRETYAFAPMETNSMIKVSVLRSCDGVIAVNYKNGIDNYSGILIADRCNGAAAGPGKSESDRFKETLDSYVDTPHIDQWTSTSADRFTSHSVNLRDRNYMKHYGRMICVRCMSSVPDNERIARRHFTDLNLRKLMTTHKPRDRLKVVAELPQNLVKKTVEIPSTSGITESNQHKTSICNGDRENAVVSSTSNLLSKTKGKHLSVVKSGNQIKKSSLPKKHLSRLNQIKAVETVSKTAFNHNTHKRMEKVCSSNSNKKTSTTKPIQFRSEKIRNAFSEAYTIRKSDADALHMTFVRQPVVGCEKNENKAVISTESSSYKEEVSTDKLLPYSDPFSHFSITLKAECVPTNQSSCDSCVASSSKRREIDGCSNSSHDQSNDILHKMINAKASKSNASKSVLVSSAQCNSSASSAQCNLFDCDVQIDSSRPASVDPHVLADRLLNNIHSVSEGETSRSVACKDTTPASSQNRPIKVVLKSVKKNEANKTSSVRQPTKEAVPSRSLLNLRKREKLIRKSDLGCPPMYGTLSHSSKKTVEPVKTIKDNRLGLITRLESRRKRAVVEKLERVRNVGALKEKNISQKATSEEENTKGEEVIVFSKEENPFDLKVGSIVWAKNGNEAYWPGCINGFKKELGKIGAFIIWCGADTYSPFIELTRIEPFIRSYDNRFNPRRPEATYHKAVATSIISCYPSKGYFEQKLSPQVYRVLIRCRKFELDDVRVITKRKKRTSYQIPFKKRKLRQTVHHFSNIPTELCCDNHESAFVQAPKTDNVIEEESIQSNSSDNTRLVIAYDSDEL